MKFAWIFNLDADFQLTRPSYSTPAKLANDLARHGSDARVLMGPNDVLATAGLSRDYTGRAWCPTERAVAALRAFGITPEPHPAQEVLRRVNHRLFAHQIGGGLPDQAYVTVRDALDVLLPQRRWLLKRPLTFAGRGQLRIEGPVTDKQSAWIDASLRRDGLIIEPLITPTRELSIHGFIWRDGRYELGLICEQLVTRGVYRAIKRADHVDQAQALFDKAAQVAGALASAGYFGPFGIDAYEHSEGFCALSEINARYTMGFATGFPRPACDLVL